jgi:hypothetical protein
MIRPGSHRWLSGPIVIDREVARAVEHEPALQPGGLEADH